MGKPTICIGENKDADQLRGNRTGWLVLDLFRNHIVGFPMGRLICSSPKGISEETNYLTFPSHLWSHKEQPGVQGRHWSVLVLELQVLVCHLGVQGRVHHVCILHTPVLLSELSFQFVKVDGFTVGTRTAFNSR